MTTTNVFERVALVRNYVENNPNPNPEMVPVTILKWETTKGKLLYRTDIGKLYINTKIDSLFEEDEKLATKVKRTWSRKAYDLIPFNTRKEIKYLYINHNKEYDFLEIGEIAIAGNRGKDGEVRLAHFTDYPRLFMFKNDLNLYSKDGVAFSNKTNFTKYLQPIRRLDWSVKADFAVQEFLGQTTLAGSYKSEYEVTPYALEEVYTRVSPKKKSKKAQQIEKINSYTDKLTPIEKIVKEHDLDDGHNYVQAKDNWYYPSLTCGYYFDELGDGWFVLRKIAVRFDVVEENERDFYGHVKVARYLDVHGKKEFSEIVRVYISDKGDCSIAEKVGDDFKVISSNANLLERGYGVPKGYRIKVFNFNEMEKCTKIKYVLPLIKEEENQVLSLVNILRHPVLEQLCKSGYTDIAKVLTVDNHIAKNIENYFGVKEKKTGALFKNLNVNKHIMNKIQSEIEAHKRGGENRQNYYYGSGSSSGSRVLYAIKNLQELFDGKFNDLTPAQINLYIEAFVGLSNAYGSSRNLNSLRRIHVKENVAYNYWRTPTFSDVNIGTTTTDIIREEKEDIKKLLKHGGNNEEFFRAYCDLLRSYSNIQDVNNRPGLEGLYDIKSLQEMIRLHDIVVEYARIDDEARMAQYRQDSQKREQQKLKKFQSLQKERIEKFEDTDSDEKYGVYVPKALTEIVKEGNDLRHYVGGYVDRHALGETNILFLRKKGKEDTSWYTIEVRDDRVVQIHGKCNCWCAYEGTDHIQYLIDYFKARKISCSKDILLETARGYGSSGNLVKDTFVW